MKPRIGVYLSDGLSARLNDAATRPGATKSALVEKALDRLLESDDGVSDSATLTRQLSAMSGQLEQLDRNLRIVSEAVALHARFHLTVTPILPAATQREACSVGAERFEEFATQVERRVDRGASLIRETIDRISTAAPLRLRTIPPTRDAELSFRPTKPLMKITRPNNPCWPRARPRGSWRQTSLQTPRLSCVYSCRSSPAITSLTCFGRSRR